MFRACALSPCKQFSRLGRGILFVPDSTDMDEILQRLSNPEFRVGAFSIPWGMLIGILGFLVAWGIVSGMEWLGWTRQVWHLPLFFVALAILVGCGLGLLLAP